MPEHPEARGSSAHGTFAPVLLRKPSAAVEKLFLSPHYSRGSASVCDLLITYMKPFYFNELAIPQQPPYDLLSSTHTGWIMETLHTLIFTFLSRTI